MSTASRKRRAPDDKFWYLTEKQKKSIAKWHPSRRRVVFYCSKCENPFSSQLGSIRYQCNENQESCDIHFTFMTTCWWCKCSLVACVNGARFDALFANGEAALRLMAPTRKLLPGFK